MNGITQTSLQKDTLIILVGSRNGCERDLQKMLVLQSN